MQFEGITYQPTEAYSEEKLRKAVAVIEAGGLWEPYIKRGDSLGARWRKGLTVALNFDAHIADPTVELDCVYFESVELHAIDDERRERFVRSEHFHAGTIREYFQSRNS